MQLHELVNTLGQDLQRRYGEKVHKLTLHGGFSCPNRDGTIGRGGCTFCNVASFADEQAQAQSIEAQLKERAGEIRRAKKYLAYFQAYTSTYAEVQVLKQMYQQALKAAEIVGLCVGTRPDCVPDAVLELLQDYVQQGFEIWLELGLQTANDQTLKRINRGHDFACYAEITQRARALGIKVCTHLIVGLPKETRSDNIATLKQVIDVGTDGIKLHGLHIVEGSTMAKAWRAGKLEAPSLEEYVAIASELIRLTPPEVVYHRVSSAARRPTLLSPLWCENRWLAMTEIGRALDRDGAQGSLLGQPFHYLPRE
ncbi:TIGR01212 family radical SAM protein [Vibrio cincinnatiensis]|uniref:Radical SAM core domain-containing protein n=1 Tax=Vibrio cincinnatiensis DSM 19608 TaxID=1123491 RepID=A0A1T4N3M4_VIBCI|nr:TIGR01212 family radical SAM protein [Vibrio cincinnatiensis]MCG3721197.1 TIGR01212 family radical SAM protein [Vibrio cincinnatiensis]MCG3731879.1 TIGR01212 family radical SAM protein [Vibrio cincinnatiensis]MCG3735297.1 TIGR01212 family radical SAM protein [Vibrio cincinnatiensis]MCG3739273.1 TIGR01212 family radical SAM protein [Vibrio cincinnatiensis]MCG3745136.1 TIGR01212 family radical SAM protein [Vibrio cincinnatiensis]